jgi:hypothetical protein
MDAHIKVFMKAIKANGGTMEADIIKLFGFTLKDNISKWEENYVQDHPNYIFGRIGINILQVIQNIDE